MLIWYAAYVSYADMIWYDSYAGFPGGSDGKASACNAGDPGSIPGQEELLEKEMAAHSSIPASKIPWTE